MRLISLGAGQQTLASAANPAAALLTADHTTVAWGVASSSICPTARGASSSVSSCFSGTISA